jgi:hypothetical protein
MKQRPDRHDEPEDGEDRLYGEADEALHRMRISYASDVPWERQAAIRVWNHTCHRLELPIHT